MPPKGSEVWEEERLSNSIDFFSRGPIIVGAGPSGLAVAACLLKLHIPCLILERSNCIASLWKHNVYDRIHLHLPKQFCELPFFPIPKHFPTYLSGAQFLEYLKMYAKEFNIKPRLNEMVTNARFDEKSGLWRVVTSGSKEETKGEVRVYAGQWLVIASGENAEVIEPRIDGLHKFRGNVIHSRMYKNGAKYEGKKVLVVGCGNSGMEIALDLIKFNAKPSIVVRNKVHVLPQEILGESTFAIITTLLKVFPVWLADRLLLFCAWCKWNNTANCGLPRPKDGPIAHKIRMRRTPVLDIGTLCLIKSGRIKVYPGIESLTTDGATFLDGQLEQFDDVVLATGYRSNVTDWLIGEDDQFTYEGLPRHPICAWKGKRGMYTVGMSGRGLMGTCLDAQLIAQDIHKQFS